MIQQTCVQEAYSVLAALSVLSYDNMATRESF